MGVPIDGKTFQTAKGVVLPLPENFGIGPDVEVTMTPASDGSFRVELKGEPKLSFKEALGLLRTLPKPETPFRRERLEFPERHWPGPS